MSRSSAFVTTCFEGFHCWPDAPEAVGFLRDKHRHVFHVRVDVSVSHSDRDVEFILFKQQLDKDIQSIAEERDTSTWSCESWCEAILDTYPSAIRVEVSEDNENGAVVQR